MKLTKEQMNEKVTITCYRKTDTMTRREALDFYAEGMMCCDAGSSECARYATICNQLMAGFKVVSDEV